MNTRLIVEIAFRYLPDTTALNIRVVDKKLRKYTQDNAVTIPYPTKIRFCIGVTGLFNDSKSLEEAWQYYRAITTYNLVNPAVLYRLTDPEAKKIIAKRGAIEGNLKEQFIVYKPPSTHFWNQNFIFVLAHMHYQETGNTFTILSPITMENFNRTQVPFEVSAFGREILVLMTANYALNWDFVKNELLLVPTQKYYKVPEKGMEAFFVEDNGRMTKSLHSFFNDNKALMMSVMNEKIAQINLLVLEKINDLRARNNHNNNNESMPTSANPMELHAQDSNPRIENNLMDEQQQVLNENCNREDRELIAKRFKHSFDIIYQREHEIENFVDKLVSDLFKFCLSPHVNFKHVYFQILKYTQFAAFDQLMTPSKLVTLSGDEEEQISTVIAEFQGYLTQLITNASKPHKNETANSTLEKHEDHDDSDSKCTEKKSSNGLI